MTTLDIENDTLQIADVMCTDTTLAVSLCDGREIRVPLSWSSRLLTATPAERENWRILPFGDGIHWPDIDEDISVAHLLRGH
jgi:hypothetical protein